MTKGTTARTITVNPLARRCGVDDHVEIESSQEATLGSDLVDSVLTSAEFGAVSDRILQFADACDREFAQIDTSAIESSFSVMRNAAEKVAQLASDVGAADLMRLAIQFQIQINQNQKDELADQIQKMKTEYHRLKKQLRIG